MSINIDTSVYTRTRDGRPYRILATDLGGEFPVAIMADDRIYRLDRHLQCLEDEEKSLAEQRRESTRYFNVYRAADGAFVLGSKPFISDYDRASSRDSQRAIAGVRITFNETTREITAVAV